MDVIGYAPNFYSLHLILPSNTTQKWPEPFAQFGCDQRTTLSRAETQWKYELTYDTSSNFVTQR